MALVSDDVNWPDDDAGRLHGKDEVRAYWTEQWARARTLDEPVVSRNVLRCTSTPPAAER